MGFPGKFYREGNRIKLQNFSEDPRILLIEEFSLIHYFHKKEDPNSVFSWIDKIAACGANGMRTLGIYVYDKQVAQQPFNWIKPDYTYEFNKQFFDYMGEWVSHADERGVVILYELFDRCLFWAKEQGWFKYDPFCPLINGDLQAFTDLGNSKLINIQKAYIQKVVDTIKPHLNVIFGVMNEINIDAHPEWHYAMSEYIKTLTKDHLIGCSGSFPSTADSKVDICCVHRGNYFPNNPNDKPLLESCIPSDIHELRHQITGEKIIGYSMDGFPEPDPKSGSHDTFLKLSPENNQQPNFPNKLRDLVRVAKNEGLQIFGYMDHCASRWLDDPITGTLRQLNETGYRAVAEVFQPTPPPNPVVVCKLDDSSFDSLKKQKVPDDILTKLQPLKGKEYLTTADFLNDVTTAIGAASTAQYQALLLEYADPNRLPDGMLYAFQARYLDSAHPQVIDDKGGKAVRATTTKGYLCVSPQVWNCQENPLPIEPLALDVYFSLCIDDNTKDNAILVIVDVYDAATQTILANAALTRKQFLKANEFTLFKLTVTPSEKSILTCRVYYFGETYLAVNKMALVKSDKCTLKSPNDIPDVHSVVPKREAEYKYAVGTLPLRSKHPNVVPDRGGMGIIKATDPKDVPPDYLSYGPYATGYPTKPLDVYFSVFIDNNTHDDNLILTLDVYDNPQKKWLVKETPITRTKFQVAGDFSLFKLSFTPEAQSTLEFRIKYNGWAHVAADWIVVVDPTKIPQINNHKELLEIIQAGNAGNGGWELVINDPLTNGKTGANAILSGGGEFTAAGCKITGKVNSYLRYDTNITGAIRVEFDAKGYISGELIHGGNDQVSVLVMQDMPHGTNWIDWEHIDGFLFQLLKMTETKPLPPPDGRNPTNGMKLKAGAALRTKFNGEWWTVLGDGMAGHPLLWDSLKTYHWDIAFEPESLEIKRDGQIIFQYWIDPLVFGKKNQPIVVYVGGDYGANNISPNNVTYSNVKIYRK